MAMDSIANPKKYTVEQLRKNRDDASYASYASDASYVYDGSYASAAYVYADAFDAFEVASAAAEFWLSRYFKQSGENKQDYIDEINKGNNMTINTLTIECQGVAGISARNDAAGKAFTKVTLEKPPMFELITAIIAQSSAEEVLSHVTAHDIALHLKSSATGDELTSPIQQAILLLQELAKKEELF